jgi:hypothetical protein
MMIALKIPTVCALMSAFALLICVGCSSDDDTVTYDDVLEINDNFDLNRNGWQGGFADYDVGEDDLFEFGFERTTLPQPLDTDQMALKLKGTNRSDDLFMFLKKKVDGLAPNTTYNARFSIEIASNVADELVGIGGSPGESVFIKVGSATVEPQKTIVTEANREIYRMNVDKGVQSNGGQNAVVIGDFSNDTDQSVYTLKTLQQETDMVAQTNANGELWLLVGTDSGFEGTTTIYYNEINVDLQLNRTAELPQ